MKNKYLILCIESFVPILGYKGYKKYLVYIKLKTMHVGPNCTKYVENLLTILSKQNFPRFFLAQFEAMPSSIRANARVKTLVVTSTSVFLSIQIIAFLATIVFYLFASSNRYRDEIAQLFIEALYPKHERLWHRRERSLEVKVLFLLKLLLSNE